MLKAVTAIAKKYAIPCRVSVEERMGCGVGACLACVCKAGGGKYRLVCKDGPVFNGEDVIWQ